MPAVCVLSCGRDLVGTTWDDDNGMGYGLEVMGVLLGYCGL